MTIALYDSLVFGPLFADQQITGLFSDQKRVQSMLAVEGALANAQAELGVIPEKAAVAINDAITGFNPDFRTLGDVTRRSGVPVPGLLEQLRNQLDSVVGQYLHYGTTSQDIVDTAHVLLIRDALALIEARLTELINQLASLAERHRQTLMSARTRSQQALPITFGMKVAVWLMPLLRHRQRLQEIKPRLFVLQFGGAVGTLAALGDRGMETAEILAHRLGLSIPVIPWHVQRDNLTELANWLSLVSGSLGKTGQDVVLMSQSEIAELSEANKEDVGSSSTMPHKSNPITGEMLVTAARMNSSLLANMHHALLAEHERATYSWQLEWNTLPQMVSCTATALSQAKTLLDRLIVNDERMRQNLEDTKGLLLAERAVFALAQHVGRTEAEHMVKEACSEVKRTGRHLVDVLEQGAAYPVQWEKMRNPADYLGQTGVLIDRVLASIR